MHLDDIAQLKWGSVEVISAFAARVARPEVWTGQGGGTMELTRNTALGYTNGVTATFATSGPAFSPNDDGQRAPEGQASDLRGDGTLARTIRRLIDSTATYSSLPESPTIKTPLSGDNISAVGRIPEDVAITIRMGRGVYHFQPGSSDVGGTTAGGLPPSTTQPWLLPEKDTSNDRKPLTVIVAFYVQQLCGTVEAIWRGELYPGQALSPKEWDPGAKGKSTKEASFWLGWNAAGFVLF
ncbi:hypothetical protein BKA82DRAFT_9349 [Pisolithus tinctorius]|nr:hypothetical protein BKA82DRAFT_9349 [Pisolithus tinctorius]